MAEPKLATCCHCGRRTVLTPTASGGHALACASCGAPLTTMKPLRPVEACAAAAHPPARTPTKMKPGKGKRRKRRKPLWRKVAEEIWDEIEDVFD
jgi:hypothetical protein